MPIRFFCQKCNTPLEVDDSDAARDVLCYNCRAKNTAPSQSDPALVGDNITVSAPQGFTSSRTQKPATLGAIGLITSIAMIGVLVFILFWGYGKVVVPVMRTPNYTSLTAPQRQKIINQKMAELTKQPTLIWATRIFFLLFLLAAAFSIAALAARRGANYGIAGLVITGIILLFVLYSTYLTSRPHPG